MKTDLTLGARLTTTTDIEERSLGNDVKAVNREILLSFWKVHILHHAAEGPLHGHWMLTELRHHGYDISPGTLYPLLQRMERVGWLRSTAAREGRRARRDYRLTSRGRHVLGIVRDQIAELYMEVVQKGET